MPAATASPPTRPLPSPWPTRDLPIDALRAAAVGVVVVGHAIVAAVAWRDGRPVADNLLATSAVARALTWARTLGVHAPPHPLPHVCG